jgi:NAD(P)-dependent dehydrogenase (short-subunit alcohol dehydrogenase family)
MPRRLPEQVVVITGASSGIGRETALQMGRRGACVVAAARNREAIEAVVDEICQHGGQAIGVAVDVSDWQAVRNLARVAVERFGHIDTWVNNAGISEYAFFHQMQRDEIDRIVQVDLLGVIYGSRAALDHMRPQGFGTIINVSSVLGVRSVPLQAVYCAAKHGVKGFTESLRLELEYENSPLDVVLVLPSSINTPLFRHARSRLGRQAKPISPIYEPNVVADAIIHAAEHPQRDIFVGGIGALLWAAQRISPSFVDWYMVRRGRMVEQQLSSLPAPEHDNLFQAVGGPGTSAGEFGHHARSTSLYTRLVAQHPRAVATLAATAGAGAIALAARRLTR